LGELEIDTLYSPNMVTYNKYKSETTLIKLDGCIVWNATIQY